MNWLMAVSMTRSVVDDDGFDVIPLSVCVDRASQPPLPRISCYPPRVGGSYCLPGAQMNAQSFPVKLDCFLVTWFGSVSSAQLIVKLLVVWKINFLLKKNNFLTNCNLRQETDKKSTNQNKILLRHSSCGHKWHNRVERHVFGKSTYYALCVAKTSVSENFFSVCMGMVSMLWRGIMFVRRISELCFHSYLQGAQLTHNMLS